MKRRKRKGCWRIAWLGTGRALGEVLGGNGLLEGIQSTMQGKLETLRNGHQWEAGRRARRTGGLWCCGCRRGR